MCRCVQIGLIDNTQHCHSLGHTHLRVPGHLRTSVPKDGILSNSSIWAQLHMGDQKHCPKGCQVVDPGQLEYNGVLVCGINVTAASYLPLSEVTGHIRHVHTCPFKSIPGVCFDRTSHSAEPPSSHHCVCFAEMCWGGVGLRAVFLQALRPHPETMG